MVHWCPIVNISYIIKNKPALVVIAICIFTIGISAIFAALYISNSNVILPNFDKKREWTQFLNYLSDRKYCLKESSNFDVFQQDSNKNNEDMSINFPLKLETDITRFNDTSLVFGRINISDFNSTCNKDTTGYIDLLFKFGNDKSLDNVPICATFKGSLGLFPNFLKPTCNLLNTQLKVKHWEITSLYTDNVCNGNKVNLNFDGYQNRFEITDKLSQADKNTIYLDLLWIGIISMLFILIILFYSILYNRNCDNI